MIDIVICRYNENCNWTKLLVPYKDKINKIYLYQKDGRKLKERFLFYSNVDFDLQDKVNVIDLENIGREAFAYTYHILNNWENLNPTLFLQGNPLEHLTDEQLKEEFKIIFENDLDFKFIYCGTNQINEIQEMKHRDFNTTSPILNVGKIWKELFVGDFKTITNNEYQMCAQFIVSPFYIKHNSLEFYLNLHDNLINTFQYQWCLEFFWEHIFNPKVFKLDKGISVHD